MPVRSPLLTTTLTLMLVSLSGWLLSVGRGLLLPFVIALILWYLINALANALHRLPLGAITLPRGLTLMIALVLIFTVITLIFQMVAANLTQLATDAPDYQARLEDLSQSLANLVLDDFTLNLRDFLPGNLVPRLVTAGASVITALASSGALVAIYVLFLLLEQSTFDAKFARLFRTPAQVESAFALRAEINRSILHYISIKTLVSAVTGLLTYVVLVVMDLPYAPLFGFVAFLLNYIPTIGSLIGVIFPGLLALVTYDSLGPFALIMVGLGLIQFSIGNLIEPRLMGRNLNLSAVVIMLSLAFWGTLWGTVGMVVCVPLTIVALIVCSKFETTRPIAVLLSANGQIEDLPKGLDPMPPSRSAEQDEDRS